MPCPQHDIELSQATYLQQISQLPKNIKSRRLEQNGVSYNITLFGLRIMHTLGSLGGWIREDYNDLPERFYKHFVCVCVHVFFWREISTIHQDFKINLFANLSHCSEAEKGCMALTPLYV